MYEKLWIITKQGIENHANAVENLETVFFDEQTAKDAGYSNVIAPTSFFAQNNMYPNPWGHPVSTGTIHIRQMMKFFKPITVGDYIYAKTEGSYQNDSKGRNIQILETTLINQKNEVVCKGKMFCIVPHRVNLGGESL